MALADKDPSAVKDYACDWTRWLQEGETVTDSTWIVPDGLTAGDGTNGALAPSHEGGVAVVWLMGGVDRTTYQVVNRITTSMGRTDDRTLTIYVRHT
jgi:hypothetical protein